MRLQWQSITSGDALAALSGLIAAILVGWAVWQWVLGRRRLGLLALAAATGAALPLALLVDTVLLWRDRSSRSPALLRTALAWVLGGAILAGVLASHSDRLAWGGFIAAQLIGGFGVIYASVFRHLGPGRLTTLLALRIASILAVLLILFKPALVPTGPASGEGPAIAILMDRSASMATEDHPHRPSRYRQAAAILAGQQDRLAGHFRPSVFHFARSASPAESIAALQALEPTGPATDATDLAAALAAAASTEPALTLLISDGIDTAGAEPDQTARRLAGPIYCLGVGSSQTHIPGPSARSIAEVIGPLTAAVNHETTFTVRVALTRQANTPCRVELRAEGSADPLATGRAVTDRDDAVLDVPLTFTPKPDAQDGPIRRYRIVLAGRPDPPGPAETATIHLQMTDPQLRVLYIEGAIRPEYKYLRLLLAGDPNIQLISMVRVQGNRFWAQGAIDGQTLASLPEAPGQLERFNVVILGDLDSRTLGPARATLLRDWVSRGGGLVMIGGARSFGPGGYGASPLADVLPVVMDPPDTPPLTGPFLPQLTGAGQSHPIVRGLEGYFPGPGGQPPDATLSSLIPLQGCVTISQARPAAMTLAVHPSATGPDGPRIILAVQKFGAGRAAAFAADTTWRWFLPLRGMGSESPYARFWGQLVRWLGGTETRTERTGPTALLRASRCFARPGGPPVALQARVTGIEGEPADDARAVVTVRPADAPAERSTEPPARIPLSHGTEAGVFKGQWAPDRPGRFTLELLARSPGGANLARDALDVVVGPSRAEQTRLARDDAMLRRLAEMTDGETTDIAALPDLLDRIIARHAGAKPAPAAPARPIYNFPLLLGVFVVVLTVEWIARRRWQMV